MKKSEKLKKSKNETTQQSVEKEKIKTSKHRQEIYSSRLKKSFGNSKSIYINEDIELMAKSFTSPALNKMPVPEFRSYLYRELTCYHYIQHIIRPLNKDLEVLFNVFDMIWKSYFYKGKTDMVSLLRLLNECDGEINGVTIKIPYIYDNQILFEPNNINTRWEREDLKNLKSAYAFYKYFIEGGDNLIKPE